MYIVVMTQRQRSSSEDALSISYGHGPTTADYLAISRENVARIESYSAMCVAAGQPMTADDERDLAYWRADVARLEALLEAK